MRQITEDVIKRLQKTLYEEEKGRTTIEKYLRDIRKLQEFLKNKPVTRENIIAYKEYLQTCGKYKTKSINTFLAAANHLFEIMNWEDCKVKMLKIQTEVFSPEEKNLTKNDYQKLVGAAMHQGNDKMATLLQTLAGTGIRISELKYITAESLKNGVADIRNKGKSRKILYPSKLQKLLIQYARQHKITSGPVFRTKNGTVLHRINIWRDMKKLCKAAGVDKRKVFPHNFRHLFAKCFYKIERDIAKLADILGHSNINTTRIYIKSTGKEHKKQLDKMEIIVSKQIDTRMQNRKIRIT